jgi:ATP phosphoribosyltransferase
MNPIFVIGFIRLPFARPCHMGSGLCQRPNPRFAIPKGRILDEALPLLEKAGIVPDADFFNKSSRALSFATNRADVKIIRVRAFDVATFVAHGAAHAGIVGSDVIDEFDYADLYAPVDLNIGHCRLSVAEPSARWKAAQMRAKATRGLPRSTPT